MKTYRWLCLSLALLVIVSTGQGAITALLPLKKLVEDSNYVLVAKVGNFDSQGKKMILTVTEDLKGKATFRQIPMILVGDDEAKKFDQPAALLKRLANDLPIVLFVNHKKESNLFNAIVYTNGTWFSVRGTGSGTDAGVWSLTHGEPYLRRTYKGTTEELRKVLGDSLSGKAKTKLPGVDEKEKPGFGPEISPKY